MHDDAEAQSGYWDRVGREKRFEHPVGLELLAAWLAPQASRVLEVGCGYGRVLASLRSAGYRRLTGVDRAPGMLARARELAPEAGLICAAASRLAIRDASQDAVLLFALLTCIPGDAAQRALVREVSRVLRPGGILYVSDLWLQSDARNLERYARFEAKHGRHGVFELEDGVVLRHHSRSWIEELFSGFARIEERDMQVRTMNGNLAQGFQLLARSTGA